LARVVLNTIAIVSITFTRTTTRPIVSRIHRQIIIILPRINKPAALDLNNLTLAIFLERPTLVLECKEYAVAISIGRLHRGHIRASGHILVKRRQYHPLVKLGLLDIHITYGHGHLGAGAQTRPAPVTRRHIEPIHVLRNFKVQTVLVENTRRVRMFCRQLVEVEPHVEIRVRDAPFNFAIGAAIAVLDLDLDDEGVRVQVIRHRLIPDIF